MKQLFLVSLISLFSLNVIAEGCMITKANERQYWFPDLTYNDFILSTGDQCVDCCAFQQPNHMPAPPANTTLISHRIVDNGENTEIWDEASNTLIAVLTASGASKFTNVYHVISTTLKVKENKGKSELVDEKDEKVRFTLSEKGKKKVGKKTEVKAIEVKTKKN